MSLRTLALTLAVAFTSAGAWADSLTFGITAGNAGCAASNPASSTCACPASPQMTCSGATCTLSGVVSCEGGAIDVQSGVTLKVTPWFSGATTEGTLTFAADGGSIDIESGATVDANSAGYTGSAGTACTGNGCVCTATPGSKGNGFGPGFGFGGQCARDGAGGGGYGGFGGAGSSDSNCGAEVPPVAGGAAYDPDPTSVTMGSAGGAAGSTDNDNGGTGPSGGGAILLYAQNITVAGTLRAHGGNGAATTTTNNDAQGGGAGGGILLRATAAITCASGNSIDVSGGNGASADDKGGAGGGGRIKLFATVADTSKCNFVTAAGSSGCAGGAGSSAVVTNSQLAAPVITSPPDNSIVGTTTPTFAGTLNGSVCAVGSPSVRLAIDGVFQSTTAAVDCTTSPGTWSFTVPSALSSGAHVVRAYAEVTVGSMGLQSPPSSDLHITISAAGTTFAIAITTPPVNTYTSSPLTNVSGTEAGLDASTVTVVATDSQGNATTLGTPIALAGGWSTGTISYTPAAQGMVVLTATATLAGTTYTDTRTYVYDSRGPSLSASVSPNPSGTASVTVSGSYSDASSGLKPGSFALQVCDADCTSNCQAVTATQSSSGFTASVSSPPLAAGDGTYCAVASIQDLAGNTSTQSATFSVDTTAPSITLNGGDPQESQTGDVSGTESDANAGPVSVTWCALAPGETCATMTTCNAAAQQGPVAPGAGGAFSADPGALGGGLAEGSYCVEVQATDLAGNSSTAEVDLTVDRSAPTVSIDPDIPPSTTPRQVCIEVSDAQPIASVDVSWTLDGISEGSLTASAGTCPMTAGGTGNYSVSVPGGIDGEVQVSASATDQAGNTSATATAGFLAVNSAPVLVLYTSADPTNAIAPVLLGSASSPIAISSATVDVFDAPGGTCGSNMVASEDVTAVASGFAIAPWTSTPLPAGQYCAVLTATDELGHTSTVTLIFTEDPSAPTLTISVSPNPNVASAPTATGLSSAAITAVSVAFSAVQPDGSCATAPEQSGSATLASGGYSFTAAAALSHGANCAQYCAVATGTDASSNSYLAFTRFVDCANQTSDNGPMTLNIDPATDAAPVSASGTAPASASTVEVTITATDANGNCTLDVVASGSATPSSGDWSVTTSPTLAAGTYCVTAVAESGSSALASASGRVTVAATTTSASGSGSGSGSNGSGASASGSSGGGNGTSNAGTSGTTSVGTNAGNGSGTSNAGTGSGSTTTSAGTGSGSSGSESTGSSGSSSGTTASSSGSGSGSSGSASSGSSGSGSNASSSGSGSASSGSASSGSSGSGTNASSSGSSGSGSSASGSSGGSSGTGGTITTGGSGSAGSSGSPGVVAGGGCSCGTGPAPADSAIFLLALGALAMRRRRD